MTELKFHKGHFDDPLKWVTRFEYEDYNPGRFKWVNIEFDFRFWAITPAFNLNFHDGFTFEFEWLCIGLYVSRPIKPAVFIFDTQEPEHPE